MESKLSTEVTAGVDLRSWHSAVGAATCRRAALDHRRARRVDGLRRCPDLDRVRDSRPMSAPADSAPSTRSASSSTHLFGVREVAAELLAKPPLVLGVILEVLPALYLVVYGRGSAAGVVMPAALALMLITILGGLKVGALNAAIFPLLLALSCLAAGRPLAAGALALTVALWASFGTASGKGAFISMPASIMTILIMVPPQVAKGHDPHTWRNVGAVFAYGLAASCWGIVIGLLLRRGRSIPSIPGASWKWGLAQGLLVGIVMAVVAAIATSRHLGQGGAWLLMTTFLVFKPLTPAPWRRSLDRAFGTILGVVLVALYLATLPSAAPTMALLVPAALMLVAASLVMLAQRWPYWCFVALFTPAIVLFLASMSSPTKTVSVARYLDVLRFEYSLLGVALALALQGALVVIAKVFHLEPSRWLGRSAP